jgi:hypothetical protein
MVKTKSEMFIYANIDMISTLNLNWKQYEN